MGYVSAGLALIGSRLERPPISVRRLAGPARAWYRNEFRELRFLVSRGLRPHHRLIDIGCGPLRVGVPLIAYLQPGHYAGFDLRPDCMVEARRRVERRGLAGKFPQLECGSFELTLPSADFGLAFSVFIHLDDDAVMAAMRFISRHVAVCYANVSLDTSKAGQWGDFPSVGRSPEFYESVAAESGLSVSWLEKRRWEARWWWRHEVMVLRPD